MANSGEQSGVGMAPELPGASTRRGGQDRRGPEVHGLRLTATEPLKEAAPL